MKCKIGSVEFTFKGQQKMAHLICKEFEGSSTKTDFGISIDIQSVEDLTRVEDDFRKREKGKFYDTGYAAIVSLEKLKITTYVDKAIFSGGFKERFAKLRDWNFLTPSEIVAKNLIYDLIEPVAHDLMMENKMGFIHASAYSKGNSCALVTSEGGMGKTALCLIAQEKGYGYLNDDLSLIDSKGNCYHHPKNLQIYGYNVKESPSLKGKLFKDKGALDKLQFNFRNLIYGPKKVRRRVPAKVLFNNIIQNARISKIFFLTRGQKLKIRNMEKDRFVKAELGIIRNEFMDYIKVLEKKDKGNLNALLKATEELYSSLYESTECLEVMVPVPFDLKRLFSYLEEEHPILTN
jgi:hypothetical protein